MRTFLAVLLGILAFGLSLVAVPGQWIERNIIDERGYVALVEPLGDDPEFQEALADTLTESVLDNLDLPQVATEAITPTVASLAGQVSTLEGYDTAWSEINSRAHSSFFPEDGTGSTTAIDIAPLAQLVVDRVNERVGTSASAPERIIVELEETGFGDTVSTLRTLSPKVQAASIALAATLLGALVLARRRSVALLWLGLGGVLSAGIQAVGSRAVIDQLAAQNTAGTQAAQRLQELFLLSASDSFDRWLLLLAGGSAVVAILGGVTAAVTGRRGA